MASQILSALTVLTVIFASGNADTKRCPMDIVYLVDQSTSITRISYKEQILPFVAKTLDNLDVQENGDHVSVVRFSSPQKTATDFHFDHSYEKATLIDLVNNLDYSGGNTATVKALEEAQTNFFTTGTAARQDAYGKTVAPVVVIVTDGVATDGDAAVKAKELITKNVHLFAIGVGPLVTQEYLEQITGDPANVFFWDKDVALFNQRLHEVILQSTNCA